MLAVAILAAAKASGDSEQRRAALGICEETLSKANQAAATLNVKRPIKRCDAIRRPKK